MSVSQLFGWMQIVQTALPLGLATVEQITALIRQVHGKQMTDQELDAALSIVFDDATRRKALALADALGTGNAT